MYCLRSIIRRIETKCTFQGNILLNSVVFPAFVWNVQDYLKMITRSLVIIMFLSYLRLFKRHQYDLFIEHLRVNCFYDQLYNQHNLMSATFDN